jgi:hypothetical protein
MLGVLNMVGLNIGKWLQNARGVRSYKPLIMLAGIVAGNLPPPRASPHGGSGYEIRERLPLERVNAFFFTLICTHLQPFPAQICYFLRLCSIP